MSELPESPPPDGSTVHGYLAVVLHAHLPFVRHPEYAEFLEEHWLYEAITEAYVPLLQTLEALVHDEVDVRLTLSMSPTLLSMLRDELLVGRYVRHLDRLIELSECEVRRTRHQPEFAPLAQMYRDQFLACRRTFVEHLGCDLVAGFGALQERGHVEILTCAATHAFMPLMQALPDAARAQISIAVEDYTRHFGRRPAGIWLPECGYYPGLESALSEHELRCFVLDAHGILFGEPRPRFGVYAPVNCPNGVAAFGRDLESSKQVWSATEGYPADPRYRDFYRDIGFDLDLDYIRPYIHTGDLRIHTGIKYHAVSGKTPHKQPYSRDIAMEAVGQHADHFLRKRQEQAMALRGVMDQPPIIVSPYDAELFGHWWFEGPQFLDALFRKMHYEQSVVKPVTLVEYLERHPGHQVQTPSYSSWGHRGYSEVWLESSNDWIYRHIDHAARTMTSLAKANPHANGHLERALNQAARELLLAQSSDWAFIMKTGTTVPYATQRTKTHVHRFRRLAEMIQTQRVDLDELRRIESIDNLLPGANYRAYASV